MDSPFKLLSAAIVHVHGNPILHNVCDSNTFRESLGVELSSVVPSLDPMGPSIPMTKRINFWIPEIVSGNSIYIYMFRHRESSKLLLEYTYIDRLKSRPDANRM